MSRQYLQSLNNNNPIVTSNISNISSVTQQQQKTNISPHYNAHPIALLERSKIKPVRKVFENAESSTHLLRLKLNAQKPSLHQQQQQKNTSDTNVLNSAVNRVRSSGYVRRRYNYKNK